MEIELFDYLNVRIDKICLQILYLTFVKKQDLALNN